MVDQYNFYLHLSLMKGFILSLYEKNMKRNGVPCPALSLSAILSSASFVVTDTIENIAQCVWGNSCTS